MSKDAKAILLIIIIVLGFNLGVGYLISLLTEIPFSYGSALASVINLALIVTTSYSSKLISFILK